MKICAISPISGGNDSRKRHEKRLIFKIGTIHPHGLNERFSFIWSHLFIVSVFVQQGWTKALKSHLFTPLFMFIHLPLIYFAPPPRLLIDFKNSKWLTYFCILLCICYCFSHLIGLRSVTWLSLLYKFTRFFYLFSVSLWRRANARNARLYYSYWQYTDLFIFRFVSLLCLRSTLRLLYCICCMKMALILEDAKLLLYPITNIVLMLKEI